MAKYLEQKNDCRYKVGIANEGVLTSILKRNHIWPSELRGPVSSLYPILWKIDKKEKIMEVESWLTYLKH